MPDPIIDPTTGLPVVDPNATPPPEFVPKADFDAVKSRLDTLELSGGFNPQPAPAAPLPAAPPGPTIADQIKTIDTDIASLDANIKQADVDEKPSGSLLSARQDLVSQRNRIQIVTEDIAPIRETGFNVMGSLSETVMQAQMPNLKHDFVKRSYDAVMGTMAPEHKMNPEVMQMAYDKAVGENVDKLTKFASEEAIRAHVDANPPPPTNTPRDRFINSAGDPIPKPEEIFDKDGMAALRMTANGDADVFYQKLGYTSYADWWEKTGKEYYGEGGSE